MRLSFPNPTLSLPVMLQRRIITLNIEAQGIRLLVARGNRVTAWQEAPLEPGLVKEGVIVDPERVGAVLKGLLDSQHTPTGRLVASVTGLRSIARILELPKMKGEMMREAVTREAKREMPVPMEDIYLSWQPLGPSNGHQRIFALGVPRDTLDPLLKAIAVTKRRPDAVDIKPLALARAANRQEAIVADVEPDGADIIVVSGGIPVIMRTVVSQAEEANGEGKTHGFRDDLARTIKFYNDTHRQDPLPPSTPLFLTGSLAAAEPVEGLAQYPIQPLAPLLECPPDLPIPSYAVNIGLALKEV